MPNALITPKGPYEVRRRLRRLEERQKEWIHRTRRSSPSGKHRNKCRILKYFWYYCTFYLVLATFAIGFFQLVIMMRLPKNQPIEPKGTALSSVPGYTVKNVKLIRYKENQKKERSPYINQIYKFVEKYGVHGIRHLRKCNFDHYWGYNSGEPCILLKLNFAVNFQADTYDDSITLPDEVPNDLYEYIMQLSVEERTNRIWVACNFMGNETIGSIEYIPDRYYDSDGLFTRGNSYLRPVSENLTEELINEDPAYRRVIGVQFKDLPVNQDIYVKCAVWAKNIPLELATTVFVLHIEGLRISPHRDDYDN